MCQPTPCPVPTYPIPGKMRMEKEQKTKISVGILSTICCFIVVSVCLLQSLTSTFTRKPTPIIPAADVQEANPTKTLNFTFKEGILHSGYLNYQLKYNRSTSLQKHDVHHKILWWNVPIWLKSSNGSRGCNISYCDYSNCVLTADKKQINDSSALIISIVNDDAPNVPGSKRNPNQAWIFFSLESPKSFSIPILQTAEWQNVFNWSMTYRRDADVFLPYGFLLHRPYPPFKNYTDIFRKKTKHVAWIVSHCTTASKREDYIKQLKEYIPVDIYGHCGYKFPDKILKDILLEYKFYLGFENALCKDYVTEKFFYYFQYDMIVIVRGLLDYENNLPNKTFINTANFPTIKALGQYLGRLGNNEEEYTQYLKRKDRYAVISRQEAYCNGLCTICEKINNIDYNRRTYGNILDWTGTCERPNDLK